MVQTREKKRTKTDLHEREEETLSRKEAKKEIRVRSWKPKEESNATER